DRLLAHHVDAILEEPTRDRSVQMIRGRHHGGIHAAHQVAVVDERVASAEAASDLACPPGVRVDHRSQGCVLRARHGGEVEPYGHLAAPDDPDPQPARHSSLVPRLTRDDGFPSRYSTTTAR